MKDLPVSVIANKPWFVLVLAQLLFLAAAWPYLSGNYVFAPGAYVAERALRAAPLESRDITPRDRYGAKDYLDQERIYLRFYRESLRSGNLPFWNERTFGGISQEDSMIYSYLSPMHWPWLVIDNDHVAKGIQLFLAFNLGALAVFWWGNILGLGPGWTLLCIVLVTLTPLSLHFQGHTHQYYAGLLMLAAYDRLLDTGRVKYLWAFFLLTCLAVAFNFLSPLFFTCFALATVSLVWMLRRSRERRALVMRVAVAALAFVLALLSLAFFLGPIILESHLVREPVAGSFRNLTPGSSLLALIDSLSYFRLAQGMWIPLFLTLPLFLFWRWRERPSPPVPASVLGLIAFLAIVTLIGGIEPVFNVFRTVFPGMKYSANATFRMLFFANICAIFALAWLFRNTDGGNRRLSASIASVLILIVGVNAMVFLIAMVPESWALLNGKVHSLWSLVEVRGLREASGIATVVAAVIAAALICRPRLESARGVFLAFLVGVGFVAMYQYQRPNLRADLDPAIHPIFQSLQPGSAVLTLEDCALKQRSWYRSEAALAGFRSFDGPTDVGLFASTRRFWAPWNDVQEFNEKGANLMEVLWVCADRVIGDSGSMHPSFLALSRILGIRYILSDRMIRDPAVRLAHRHGSLNVFAVDRVWSDVSFIPGYRAETFSQLLLSLASGKTDAVDDYRRIEALRVTIPATRLSNLSWQLEPVPSMSGREGALFMNHPIEYHRGLSVPLLGLPLEGKWRIQVGDDVRDFPLFDAPFRALDMTMGQGQASIFYSLAHYAFWLPISVIALLCFILLQSRAAPWLGGRGNPSSTGRLTAG